MTDFLSHFHFIRPWWLLGIIPAIGLFFWNLQLNKRNNTINSLFAPHLLPYLIVKNGKDKKILPHNTLLVFCLLAVFAVAGPTWRQEPSPFADDQAALVIIIRVTPSMLAKDIQPSRLERSVHKIGDLLELRAGALTALVAYSGSAHQVMPLTRDNSVITAFARELTPKIMPKEGDAVVEVLKLATEILTKSGGNGSILLITDSIGEGHQAGLLEYAENNTFPIQILAMAALPGMPIPADSPPAPALDRPALQRAAETLGANLTLVAADTHDIEQINRAIVRSHKEVVNEGEDQRWQDSGYYLLPVLILLSLFWCRRGWFVRWES